MPKLLGQVLAFFAVAASAFNAQCAVSCSLQTAKVTAAYEVAAYSASHAGHACCPSQRSSSSNQQERHKQPCPNSSPVIGSAVEVTPLQYWDTPHLADFDCGNVMRVSVPMRRAALPEAFDFSGLPGIPAFSVLRV